MSEGQKLEARVDYISLTKEDYNQFLKLAFQGIAAVQNMVTAGELRKLYQPLLKKYGGIELLEDDLQGKLITNIAAEGWEQKRLQFKMLSARNGWGGVWDAFLSALTGQKRATFMQDMTISFWVKDNKLAHLAFSTSSKAGVINDN